MKINPLIRLLLLMTVILPVYFSTIFNFSYSLNIVISIISIFVVLFSYKSDKNLFPTILFFSIVQILNPVCFQFSNYLGLWFPGIYYLIPILIYIFIILIFKNIRANLSWWTKDKFSISVIILVFILILLSSFSLIFWSYLFPSNFDLFLKQFPTVSFMMLIINGVLFALFNSFVEEFMTRGMLCNGIEKIIINKNIIILIQAIIFGISHFYGFPGGFLGITMVFFWSLILGIIRYKTKGLVGVIIAHFFADLSIYFILYAYK